MSEPNLGMEFSDLRNEIESARNRLEAKPVVDYKQVLLQDIFPLLSLMAESAHLRMKDSGERLELIEDTVAEYFAGSESRIMPQLAARIDRTLAIGLELCNHLIIVHQRSQESLAEQYRAAGEEVPEGGIPMPPELSGLIQLYQQNAQITAELVRDVTVAPLDDEGDDGDEDEDEDQIVDDDEPADAVDKALEDANA